MLGAVERDSWTALERRLRTFVGKRVRNSSDVDDVLQEILIRVHRGVGELRSDELFGPWTYRVARNALVDHQRARARAGKKEGQSSEDIESKLAVDESSEQELAHCLVSFLSSLPEIYRETLTLTEIEGLPHARAAEALGISLSNVKARVARGRQKLKDIIEGTCVVGLDVRGHVISCETRPADPSGAEGYGGGSLDTVESLEAEKGGCCGSSPSTRDENGG